VFFFDGHIINFMNAFLSIKFKLTNCMIKCNVALMLFLFLSVSFINVAEVRDLSLQEKVTYLADFEYVADNLPEYDSGDDSVGIPYDVIENCDVACHILAVQVKATSSLNCAFQRPLTRAPPNALS
jgi:hypothetical protein